MRLVDSIEPLCLTKEIIDESVNLKVVYEPKQNSFGFGISQQLQVFSNVGSIFYKVHSLISEQFFN